jgi:RND family efflux transporter MFP subunit
VAAAADAGLVASGYVVARRKSAVAAEVTGKVTELLVDEGSVVREGDVIARLDTTLAEKDVSLARSRESAAVANSDSIAADLADAERVLDRTSQLLQKGFSTAADLSKVEAHRNVLRAQLHQANEQILTSRLDVQRTTQLLEKYTIHAPFDGVVTERNAEVGELISPTSPGSGLVRNAVCTMIDTDSLEIDVDVNEAYIGRVRPGSRVSAILQSYPDWSIPASVFAFSPMANRDKATVGVRIALTGKDQRVVPGLDVKVTFQDDVAAEEPPPRNVNAAGN